jgi:hypothetical protein
MARSQFFKMASGISLYLAPMQERLFIALVLGMSVLSVAIVVAILFWH